jgi:hypothetical protein
VIAVSGPSNEMRRFVCFLFLKLNWERKHIKLTLLQIRFQNIQMMKVIVVFNRLLASGNDQHCRHLFKWG